MLLYYADKAFNNSQTQMRRFFWAPKTNVKADR